MKRILFIAMTLVTSLMMAQSKDRGVKVRNLEEVPINPHVTTHFVSSEKIDYVDISSNDIIGDLINDKVLRIKPINEVEGEYILTIVAETYIKQYKLIVVNDEYWKEDMATEVRIDNYNKLDRTNLQLTQKQLHDLAFKAYVEDKKGRNNMLRTKKNRLEMGLNNIYVHDDYIFIDVVLKNKTNIPFTIDQTVFSIKDRKITKATNSQELRIKPIYTYLVYNRFEKRFRNIYVFEKFTFPDNKSFSIMFDEEQISGRKLELLIDYRDLLRANTL